MISERRPAGTHRFSAQKAQRYTLSGPEAWAVPEALTVPLLLWLWFLEPGALRHQAIAAIAPVGTALLLIPFVIRTSWCGAVLAHGLGHTFLVAGVDRNRAALCLTNLLEHRSPSSMARLLLPFSGLSEGGHPGKVQPWIEAGDPAPWRIRLKATGGLVLNLAVGMAMIWLIAASASPQDHRADLASWIWKGTLWSLLGSNVLLLIRSRSDWAAMITGHAERFHCGNFGFIALQEPIAANELLSRQGVDRFRRMGLETEVRGAQAGGGLVLARDRSGHVRFVGHKQINAKRRNLTRCLESAFCQERLRAVRAGLRPLESTITAAWHYRFATSGPPAVQETHWHEWCPRRVDRIWEIRNGQWVSDMRNINHRITHNGDFDGIELFGDFIDHATLGLWLGRVLHTPVHCTGDSAKIAGMMDLLICQGNWLASLRLAFQLALAKDIQASFGGQAARRTSPVSAPCLRTLHRWATIFESSFEEHVRILDSAEDFDSLRKRQQLQRTIVGQLRNDPQLTPYSEKRLWEWIETTVNVFRHNDPPQATRTFLAKAQGSFGLVTLSTLMPNQVVLASLGQPITIGFDPDNQTSLYASEPAAIDAVLASHSRAYRVDLKQNNGEIAVLDHASLTVYSLSAGRFLYAAELVERRIHYRDHAYLQPQRPCPDGRKDPVEADLQDIPRLLLAIKDDWIDPSSANRQSAEYFVGFLIVKARYQLEKQERLKRQALDPALARSNHVDLLVTGVENSLRVGTQFARDLASIFPLLTVKVISSNQLLQKLQHDIESLGLAKQTIVLAITQSGQTFPTRQAIEAFDLFVRQGVIREIFILTGEPTSFAGSSILKPTFSGEPFCRRLFVNGSGRRRAEPATATVAATHQSLTELLFSICHQLQRALPDQHPFGMTLSAESLLVLENMEDHLFLQTVSTIMGADFEAQARPSRLYAQLLRAGQRWSQHVLEAPFAWTFHALYVLITVGWAIPFGNAVPLLQTLWKGHLLAAGINPHIPLIEHLTCTMATADLGIYIFGPWLWTLGLRLLQRRQLLARTGKRSLLIGDTTWVHHLLTSYVSKLFSLSYGITSLEIHGANPQDELVHDHTHRIVRGSLLYLGVPDGRCSQKQRSEESAVILAGRQASGVQNLGSGPEVVVLGSNPLIASSGFGGALVLPSPIHKTCQDLAPQMHGDIVMESLRESRFGSFRRLLASYVFFWSMAKTVAEFPLLHYEFWKSQSQTKVMTTAAPVSAARLDCPEQAEVANLQLARHAHREQS